MAASDSHEGNLLPKIASGDADAVRACLDRYSPLVWSIAKKLGSDASIVEDVVQEIFIDLWKSAARYDESVSSEATFISMIARRRLIDRRRKIGRQPDIQPLPEKLVSKEPSGSSVAEIQDDAAKAKRAMEKLRPEQRQVLQLSVVEGMTHQQIASHTSMPLGTVKTHARRGLMRIRELLEVRDAGTAEGVSS